MLGRPCFAILLALGAGIAPVRLTSTALAQARLTVTFRDVEVHGRKAWILENGRIHVAMLHDGGHIAEIQFLSDNPRLSINPMFIPAGNGYMGHMVCFPNFGPARLKSGRTGSGDTEKRMLSSGDKRDLR
jgi:hypothetical protein